VSVTATQRANLARSGRGHTSRPRIYVGCIPCGQRYWVADLEHANRWIVKHWERCKRSPPRLRRDAVAQDATKALGPTQEAALRRPTTTEAASAAERST
jgi:hypothetical protein